MEEKDYALISDRELVDRLLIGDEEIVRYLFFDKCTPMFNYILHRFCPCQLDKNELINELYLYLQSDNWYKLRQFDFRSKLTTWLTVVAVRFFQKRKGVLMDYRNQSAPIKEEEKVFDFLPELISKMDVWNAIRKMNNERYRQVLVDLELKDLDPKVLAREMNVTVENLYPASGCKTVNSSNKRGGTLCLIVWTLYRMSFWLLIWMGILLLRRI